MRIAEKICGVLVFVSLLLKLALIPLSGLSLLFVFAFLTIALIYFPLGFAFFNQIRLRRIFKSESYKGLSPGRILGAIGVGISLSPICLGIIFKIQDWPGANNMLEAGLIPSFIILIIAIYKYFKSTDHYYKRIVIRLLIIGVFGLTLLFTTQLRLVKIQFRNHPQYVHAYELYCKNPEDEILRYKLEIEFDRATMSDEDFKLYQSDEDFIYHQKLLEEQEATQPTNESNSNYDVSRCTGNGTEGCISEIRQRFRSTGKDIIGEQYDGDGLFQIQFIEYGKGTYNASVRTNCDCEIANVNVTPYY